MSWLIWLFNGAMYALAVYALTTGLALLVELVWKR